MQWTHFNSLLCKEFGKAGILPFLTKILCAYTKSKPPSEVRMVRLYHNVVLDGLCNLDCYTCTIVHSRGDQKLRS